MGIIIPVGNLINWMNVVFYKFLPPLLHLPHMEACCLSYIPSTLALLRSSIMVQTPNSIILAVLMIVVAVGGGLEYLHHPIELTLNLCCNVCIPKKTDLLKRGNNEFSSCWFFFFLWFVPLPSSHVFLISLKILGSSFSDALTVVF